MQHGGRTAVAPSTSVTGDDVVQHAPDGLAVIDADARFVDANPAAVLLCGLDPAAVAGAPSPFPAPDDAAERARGRADRRLDAGHRSAPRVRLRPRPGSGPSPVDRLLPRRDPEPAARTAAGRDRQGRLRRGLQALARRHPGGAGPGGGPHRRARRRPGPHGELVRRPVARHGRRRLRARGELLRQAHGVPGPGRAPDDAGGAAEQGTAGRGEPVRRHHAGSRVGPPPREHARSPVGLVRQRAPPRPRGAGRHPERLLRARPGRRGHRAGVPARDGRAGRDGRGPGRAAGTGTGRRPPRGASEARPRPARLGRAAGLLDDDAGPVARRARRPRDAAHSREGGPGGRRPEQQRRGRPGRPARHGGRAAAGGEHGPGTRVGAGVARGHDRGAHGPGRVARHRRPGRGTGRASMPTCSRTSTASSRRRCTTASSTRTRGGSRSGSW